MCLGGRISGHPCIGCEPTKPQSEPFIIPLTGVKSSVKVFDYIAEVTIEQRFENQEEFPIEAVYEFPIDPKASVCEFYAEIDNIKIVGQIKEKEKAKEEYDDAISSGHGAYLLEQDKTNKMFTVSLGNFPPNKEILIHIVYVTELEFSDGKLKLILPANPYPPDGTNSKKFILPKNKDGKYSKDIGYGLQINIKLEMTSNIKSISSPTHPIQFNFGENMSNASVTLSNNNDPLGKDFEILILLSEPEKGCSKIEIDDQGNSSVMIAFYPKLDEIKVINEMIFLVDRSGSMSGSKIKQVCETLEIFLRSLPEGTFFNIIGFGSSSVKLFPESKPYNDQTLNEASNHVKYIEADLGGTNIINPLKEIFKQKTKKGIPRQLFILTDGEVENTTECLNVVRTESKTTRVFAFGIGAEASRQLVYGMAKQGEGEAEFINSGESMDSKVLKQLDRALKSALTEVKVIWKDKLNENQTPFIFPPLFDGGRSIIYRSFKKGKKIPNNAIINAMTSSGPYSLSISIDNSKIMNGNLIHKLLCRSMIRDLEEGRSCHHSPEGKFILKGKTVEEEIISLSIKSGIISSYTAFIAIEKRQDSVEGEMKLRKISIHDILSLKKKEGTRNLPRSPLPRLSSSSSKKLKDKNRLISPPSPQSFRSIASDSSSNSLFQVNPSEKSLSVEKKKQKEKESSSLKKEFEEEDSSVGKRKEVKEISATDKLRELISQQRANGSFPFTALKLIIPSISQEVLNQELPVSKEAIDIFITAVIMNFISTNFPDQKVSWNLVLRKSSEWIKKEESLFSLKDTDWNALATSFLAKRSTN